MEAIQRSAAGVIADGYQDCRFALGVAPSHVCMAAKTNNSLPFTLIDENFRRRHYLFDSRRTLLAGHVIHAQLRVSEHARLNVGSRASVPEPETGITYSWMPRRA
jgi:hypothetical protein